MERRTFRTLLIAGGIVVGAAGVSWATAALTTSTSTNTINACQQKETGLLRVVTSLSDCRKDEVPISWNVQGPKGDMGATGATGAIGPAGANGAVGPAGPAGATGSQGLTGPAGAQGVPGSDGAVGPAGPPGATGPAGPAGPAGAPGAGTGIASLEALQGIACMDGGTVQLSYKAGVADLSCDTGGTKPPPPPPVDAGGDPSQECVDIINNYRSTIGAPPLQRWTEEEACASSQAQTDAQANQFHSVFQQCGENGQNECAGFATIADCLAQMWSEGPNGLEGHYQNMASTKFTKVACGYGGTTFMGTSPFPNWMVQDFH